MIITKYKFVFLDNHKLNGICHNVVNQINKIVNKTLPKVVILGVGNTKLIITSINPKMKLVTRLTSPIKIILEYSTFFKSTSLDK